MCIRDRVLSQKNVRRVKAGLSIEDLADDIYRRTLLQSLNAVSYTHLRAHETVLDLVCRLLLEKKHMYSSYSVFSHE